MKVQAVDFDQEGWTVDLRPNGFMQITGRSPRGARHALFDVATLQEPTEPGNPAIAVNADGQRYELVKSAGGPVLGKAHSAIIAQEFIALGWVLKHEFRADGDTEPYEYVFEWKAEGDATYPKHR